MKLQLIIAICCLIPLVSVAALDRAAANRAELKTESFDRDPGWMGENHRIARKLEPREVRQDFGYSPQTNHAGGASSGEIGGFVTAAGEAAFYGKPISEATLEKPLSASGTLSVGKGGTNLLLGYFNADTTREWRTPNTIAIRINARGDDKFFAYVEYCTAKWRAGGDTTPFPSVTDPDTGRWNLIGFPCETSLKWSLRYDPTANDGRGVVTATIGDATAECRLDDTHRADGATFNRFGILNVTKSADSGSELWLDDVAINGGAIETFDEDPEWDGRQNRTTYLTRMVRPWFDFGYSDSNFAGGKSKGELGGCIFRGDCRYAERIASYGDRVGPLKLDKPLKASGKVALRRGVSDSTTLFGFYNSEKSVRQNDSQREGLPENVFGIHIEGPSSDGFHFYPVRRLKGGGGETGPVRESPIILPDGRSHDWSFEYDPTGSPAVAVTLDQKSVTWTLPDRQAGDETVFDRFGIVTSWIDGNSQDVYWDDVTYTVSQDPRTK
jgi:hypothetical protein